MLISMYSADVTTVGQVGPDEARRQFDTICSSQAFRNRDSFRRLLNLSLADRTLDGSADTLKEYTLGLELFGKPESYDPREDATVRVQIEQAAREARRVLFVRRQGRPGAVELPRRHLALTFQARSTPPVPAPAIAAPPITGRSVRNWQLALGAILLSLIGFELGRHLTSSATSAVASTSPVSPEVQTFWAPMLSNGRPVVVSLGTPMFIRFRGTHPYQRHR